MQSDCSEITQFRTVRGHTYVIRYTSDQLGLVAQASGRWASNPDLGFSWYDAAEMINQAKSTVAVVKPQFDRF